MDRKDDPGRKPLRRKRQPTQDDDSSLPSDTSPCSCSSCDRRASRKKRKAAKSSSSRRSGRRRRTASSDDASGAEAGKRGAVSSRYGRYGLIFDGDKHNKRPEFQLWLAEVKGAVYENLNAHEERQLFSQFAEDFNTATFPSKKYYDLNAWESRKGKRSQKRIAKTFDDEEQRRLEVRRVRELVKEKETNLAYEHLKNDSEALQAMRRQRELRHEMDYYFKTGKLDQARIIQAQLRATPNANEQERPPVEFTADDNIWA